MNRKWRKIPKIFRSWFNWWSSIFIKGKFSKPRKSTRKPFRKTKILRTPPFAFAGNWLIFKIDKNRYWNYFLIFRGVIYKALYKPNQALKEFTKAKKEQAYSDQSMTEIVNIFLNPQCSLYFSFSDEISSIKFNDSVFLSFRKISRGPRLLSLTRRSKPKTNSTGTSSSAYCWRLANRTADNCSAWECTKPTPTKLLRWPWIFLSKLCNRNRMKFELFLGWLWSVSIRKKPRSANCSSKPLWILLTKLRPEILTKWRPCY